MSYQKTNIVPSGFGIGSAGSKFANRNLNTSGVAKPGTSKEKTFGSTIKGNYVMQGVKSKVGKAVGAAAAPTPLNTPSIRRENNGKDINIALVQVGNPTVWGVGGEKQTVSQGVEAPFIPTSPVIAKPAPWTKTSQDVVEDRDHKVKKPTTPSKSWADAESDEDDEDGRSAPSTPARVAAATSSSDMSSTQREAPRFEHSNGIQLRPTYQLRPNQGIQRDHSDSGSHHIQQHLQQQSRGPSFEQTGHNHNSQHTQQQSYQGKNSLVDEQERQQQRAIEASRLELEQLESRKIRQQEQQQQQQQQHSFQQSHSQGSQFSRAPQAQSLGQSHLAPHSQPQPQSSSSFFGSSGDYLRGSASFNSHLQSNNSQHQQQFSGSGLLNSSGNSRVSVEEPLTWERAKRRPIEAPPTAPNRPVPPVSPSTHFVYSHNGLQQQQQHLLGAPVPSSQYSHLLLMRNNRSRGPSEDLSAPTVRQQELLQERQTEIRLKEATAQAAAVVDPNKSFASLFPKPAAAVTEVSEEAEISAADAAYHQQDTHSSKYRVAGEGQHHAVARNLPTALAAAPQRKMLFEPKSGQFVDSAAPALEASTVKNTTKHTPAPSGSSGDAAKWARAPRKVDAVAADSVAVADNTGALSKVPTAVLARVSVPSIATVRSTETPASKLALAEEYHQEREAAKVAERNLERRARGARTLGLLFRFVGEATGEAVDSRDIEQVLTAAERTEAEKKRAEVAAQAVQTGASSAKDGEVLGHQLYKRSTVSTKPVKEHKLLIKKVRTTKTSTSKQNKIQSTEDKSAALQAAVDSFDTELSKLQLSNETAEPRTRWTQGSGMHLLQPQQNPDVELDSSLSDHLHFGGILSVASSSSTVPSSSPPHDSPHWNYNSFESNNGISSNYYILDGFSLFDGSAPPPLLTAEVRRSGDEGENRDPPTSAPIERVKRGAREKFSVKNTELGERKAVRSKTAKVVGVRVPRRDGAVTDHDTSPGAVPEHVKDKRVFAGGRGGRGGEGRGSKMGTPRKGGPSAQPLSSVAVVATSV